MENRKRKTSYQVVILILMLLSLVSLPGCWSLREADSLAIVMGVGIDKAKNAEGVNITVQIIKPSEVKTAGGGRGGGSGEKPYWNVTNTGKTVFQTFRQFTHVVNRRIYLSHSQVLILSNEIARDGVSKYLDLFYRDPEPRLTSKVLVAKEKAGDVLETATELEKIPALNLSQLLEVSAGTSEISVVNLNDFSKRLMSKTTAPIASLVEVSGEGKEKKAKLAGTAVFKKDKLVGELTLRESRGLLWVINKIKSGIIIVKSPGGEGEVSLEILRANSKIMPGIKDGKPYFTVKIKEEGNLGEEMCTEDLTTMTAWAALEENQAEAIRQEVEAALKKAQELNADIFGFGDAVHRKYPAEWKDLESRWDEVFPQIEVEIEVEAKLRHSGMTTKPTTPESAG